MIFDITLLFFASLKIDLMSIFALSAGMCKFVHVSSIIDSIHHIILLLFHSFSGSNSQNHSKNNPIGSIYTRIMFFFRLDDESLHHLI